MAAYLSRLHHISLHVSNVDKIAHTLVSKFQFNLFAVRLTDRAKQLAFRKGSAVFVVNERPVAGHAEQRNGPSGRDCHSNVPPLRNDVYVESCPSHRDGKYLYDVQPSYSVDTACNVCFEVDDVEGSSATLSRRGCDVIVPPTRVRDERGLVTYSVVKSIVGNVCHTLVDRTQYGGDFLPGFHRVQHAREEAEPDSCPITHFDHVTYACPRGSARAVMRWYEKNFSFQRFFIGSNEDVEEGFVLDQDGIGLRLTAMEYCKGETEMGVRLPFKDKKEPDCKFVIAESLPKQGQNQVDTFLEQHHGPGMQHIGLFTENIVSTAHTMAQAGVQFFSPPPTYYTEVGKQREIEEAGHDPKMLMQQGILLDTDIHTPAESPNTASERYLLQVFTKPVFSEDTFFLELIERRGATGFGEGNIRALWRSVQSYMESEEREQPDSQIKTKQTGQH